MAERSNREIRKALKQYGKSKGYGSLWKQRTYDWLKQMREQDPTNESYVRSMNNLFGNSNEGSSQNTSPYTLNNPTWSASEAWNRTHQNDLSQNVTKTWSGTHTTSNPEVEEPVQEQETPVDYSYGGTGNNFWNTSAQTFISNLNKTDAGRGALKGYDTNGDNIISEDELRAMQGGKNLTADAKVGSRTLGAFKDLMNEEDYNNSLNTYNNWLNSRRIQNTTTSTSDSTSNTSTNVLTQDQQDYNNMTAGVSTEGANLNRYKTGTQRASTTPSDMSDYSGDSKAPNNNPNNGFGNMYQGNDGNYYPKESSPWFSNVNGTYVKKSNQEYQQNPNTQQPGILTKDWNTEKQAYKAVGNMALSQAKSQVGSILNRLQWVRNRWNSEEARKNRSRTIGEMTR